MNAVKAAVEQFGLTAAALAALPTVPMHDADLPRVAIYSSWSEHAGDRLGTATRSTSSAFRST